MIDIDKLPKIDSSEIRKCTCCGKGMMHTGSPVFYELTIVSCILDAANILRMHGLEMMMGGNVGIARVFSPDNTIARKAGEPVKHWLCSECAAGRIYPLMLLEGDS